MKPLPILIFTLITFLGCSSVRHAVKDRTYDIVITGGGRAFSLPHKGFAYACGAEYLGKLYGPLKKITRELKLTVREIPYPMDVYFDNGSFYNTM